MSLPATKPTVNTASTDDLPTPRVCEQKAVTLPLELFIKDKQQYPYGTPEYNATYNLRNKVESYNPQLFRAGLRFGSFRTTGLQNFALAAEIVALAANLHAIRGWSVRNPHDLE